MSICLMRLPVTFDALHRLRWRTQQQPERRRIAARRRELRAAAHAIASSERRNVRARVEFCAFMEVLGIEIGIVWGR